MQEQLGHKISSKRAWKTADLNQYAAWKVVFSTIEFEQLENAATGLPADRRDWLTISKHELNAPELVDRIDAVAAEINSGYGFAKISGLDISEYDQDMINRIYWVIAICLGDVVAQNAKGEMIGAVTDLIGGAERGTDDRGYTSSDELRFHCDGGGVSSLFCVRQAPSGGENAVVSLLSIYNEILENHPQHLEVLHRGFPLYQRKEEGDGREKGSVSRMRIPTFTEKEGRMTAWLNLKLAELASEVSNSPYSDAESKALKAVEEIAERDEFKFSFRLAPGDMIIFNNFSMMHKRSAFQDDPDPDKRRLMLRLWLNLHCADMPAPEVAMLRTGFPHAAPIITAE
jgi:hypothetical protein